MTYGLTRGFSRLVRTDISKNVLLFGVMDSRLSAGSAGNDRALGTGVGQ